MGQFQPRDVSSLVSSLSISYLSLIHILVVVVVVVVVVVFVAAVEEGRRSGVRQKRFLT